MELPEYTVYVEIPRILFSKTLKHIGLGLLAYIAIITNFIVLKKTTTFATNILFMIIIILGIMLLTIISYLRISNYQYQFYSNRIEKHAKKTGYITYDQIRGIEIKRSLLDAVFNTGKIDLGGFSIDYVPNLNQIYFYVQKMAELRGGYNPATQQQSQQVQQQNYQQR
ncbi:hypothetical protein GOV05_01060 [Candidatus Woesearchaeota archaeon]|nr:hypothetical protein [Candidatus Woesearchaeota archaeon]